MSKDFVELVNQAKNIVIIQADNPDADSLGSALALEEILDKLGKQTALYCGMLIPEYLRYLDGWSRVLSDLPSQFDLSIIVDASTTTLLQKLIDSGQINRLRSKPCVVIDHHANVESPIDFAELSIISPTSASTGEQIFDLCKDNAWEITQAAAESIMASILGDTQGLSNELTTAHTYRTMAELTEIGVDRAALEDRRREFGKMAPKIFSYKADLIKKTEFLDDGQIAFVTIPQAEINEYSPLYNPVPLIQPDILQVKDVAVVVVFKVYDDGRVTGAIKSNNRFPVAGKLAEAMGGGGHAHASGFRVEDGRSFNEIKHQCHELATRLLEDLPPDTPTVISF